jgi:hypothetical protein
MSRTIFTPCSTLIYSAFFKTATCSYNCFGITDLRFRHRLRIHRVSWYVPVGLDWSAVDIPTLTQILEVFDVLQSDEHFPFLASLGPAILVVIGGDVASLQARRASVILPLTDVGNGAQD